MAVTVMIRFPVPFEKNAALLAERPELMQPIDEIVRRHGLISHFRLLGADEFIDFDTFPDRETYIAFKREALPHIERYEAALGVTSEDTVWDLLED